MTTYVDIDPLKMQWDKFAWFYDHDRYQGVIMTIDKLESLYIKQKTFFHCEQFVYTM